MRAALTQMVIDKLPIPSAKVDHRDTRLKGLVLRVMPSGTKSYYCEYARGKRV
jgi:Arm DNA-binding domain